MARKRIKLTDTKAFSVEGVIIDGKPFISVRQMYATRKEPGVFKPGRQGIVIDHENAGRLARAIGKTFQEDPADYKVLERSDK